MKPLHRLADWLSKIVLYVGVWALAVGIANRWGWDGWGGFASIAVLLVGHWAYLKHFPLSEDWNVWPR